jgi:hypothetical protein
MTMKIQTINRPSCKLIRAAIDENLAEICEELGLKMEHRSGSFDDNQFTAKISFILADADPAKDEFEMWAKTYGVAPTDYGRVLKIGTTTYRLTGINTKAPKYPFLAVRESDEGKFKFTSSVILRALGVK